MAEQLIGELISKADRLHEGINSSDWKHLNRQSFIAAVNSSIFGLQETLKTIEAIRQKIKEEPTENAPDLLPLAQEYNRLLNVLNRNLEMEKNKSEPTELELTPGREEEKELYSDLAERILSLLIKTRQQVEHLQLHQKSQSLVPLEGKSSSRTLIELLKEREKELQEVKEKHEKLKKEMIVGRIEEGSSVDKEHELNEIARKIEKEHAVFEREHQEHTKKLEELSTGHANLKRKSKVIEELIFRFMNKGLELTKILKKERDYAKRVLLEIEHESLKLRNAYSKELLNLEEAKLKAKQDASKNVARKIKDLEEETREKGEVLEQFKKLVYEKEKKIEELDELLKREKLKQLVGFQKEKTKKPFEKKFDKSWLKPKKPGKPKKKKPTKPKKSK